MRTVFLSVKRASEISRSDRFDFSSETTLALLAYCRANDWAGYDPYDALNSRVFRALPFLDFKTARLVLTQLIKRFPINLRPLLAIPKSHNPKGIALFLAAWLKLDRIGLVADDQTTDALTGRLLELRSPGWDASCWGYNFDWQTRSVLVPRGFPNIICTTFAANALLDAWERSQDSKAFEAALSAAEFIRKILFWRDGGSVACFCYTSLERSIVHNANLLGAAFLCRVARISGRTELFEPAFAAARYSVSRQQVDGAWDYGEAPTQHWIDNFHTGFNLSALRRICDFGETAEFEAPIRRGFDFYRAHFFRGDGAPRYYHDATYPIDIHSAAQSIITLVELRDLSVDNLDLARAVLAWTYANMRDRRGFFYFQKHPHLTVRIPFMRWSQAWMLLALASLCAQESAPV